jgi:hypothetical protein
VEVTIPTPTSNNSRNSPPFLLRSACPRIFGLIVRGNMSGWGFVSRASSVDPWCATVREMKEGPFEVGNQVLISSHRELLSSKAMVVNVAEKSE